MSHIPPLPKRSSARPCLPGYPLLTDSRGYRAMRPRPARDLAGGTALLVSILLSGVVFALFIWALIWAFAVLEAVL